jgi:pyruvate dehydrogenase (quinone)
MKAAGIVDFGTDLHNPNFAKIAEAAGLLGLTAETPDQVVPLIAQALKHDGPALVEVLVSRQELSMPPTSTLEQAKGFSLFMMRAVLSGRGNEIIDLAKVNLFRSVRGRFSGFKRTERKQREWLQNSSSRSQVFRISSAGWISSTAKG